MPFQRSFELFAANWKFCFGIVWPTWMALMHRPAAILSNEHSRCSPRCKQHGGKGKVRSSSTRVLNLLAIVLLCFHNKEWVGSKFTPGLMFMLGSTSYSASCFLLAKVLTPALLAPIARRWARNESSSQHQGNHYYRPDCLSIILITRRMSVLVSVCWKLDQIHIITHAHYHASEDLKSSAWRIGGLVLRAWWALLVVLYK